MSSDTRQNIMLDSHSILLQRASIPTSELHILLRKIARDLSKIRRCHVSLESCENLARILTSPELIKHENVEIVAYCACAAAEIFRLDLLDTTVVQENLSPVLDGLLLYFIEQAKKSHIDDTGQWYILERFLQLQLASLIPNLQNSSRYITLLFNAMFKLTTKCIPSNLEPLVSTMLAECISRMHDIPDDLSLKIIDTLVDSDGSHIVGEGANTSSTTLNFAMAICEKNLDKMAAVISRIFSMHVDQSSGQRRDLSFEALKFMHCRLVQIWSHLPELLELVMKYITDELESRDEDLRSLATEFIGSLLKSSLRFDDNSSASTFIAYHKYTWEKWLEKSLDNFPTVATTWVEQTPGVLSLATTQEIDLALRMGLSHCLACSNMTVRLSACKALESLPISLRLRKVYDESMITTLFQLLRDENEKTRAISIHVLAQSYNECITSILSAQVASPGVANRVDYKHIENIIVKDVPNKILGLYYIKNKRISAAVDLVLFETLLPFEDSAENRVRRLCCFVKALEEKAKLAFIIKTKTQEKIANGVLSILKLAKKYGISTHQKNSRATYSQGEREKKLMDKQTSMAQWLSARFSEHLNFLACLEAFLALKNLSLFELLEMCVSSDLDYNTMRNSTTRLLKRLRNVESTKLETGIFRVTAAEMIHNFKILIYNSFQIFYNKSNFDELIIISHLRDSDNYYAAIDLIKIMITNSEIVCKSYVAHLVNMVKQKDPNDISVNLLQSLHQALPLIVDKLSADEFLDSRMHALATNGTYLQAKWCSKIIVFFPTKAQLTEKILKSIMPLNPRDENIGAHFSFLAETYLINPTALTLHSSKLDLILVEQFLQKNRILLLQIKALNEQNWISEDQLFSHRELVAKLMSIRLIGNKLRCIGASEITDSAAFSAAKVSINLFANIIVTNGELVDLSTNRTAIATPKCYRLRLKLMSGLMLLKFARLPAFQALIDHKIVEKITLLLLDEDVKVRKSFLESMRVEFEEEKLPKQFWHLIFVMAHEPDVNLDNCIMLWMLSQQQKIEILDEESLGQITVRLIHAMACDKNFSKLTLENPDGLSQRILDALNYLLRYVSMFVNTMATETNISMLYCHASCVKLHRVKCIESSVSSAENNPACDSNLYQVVELFQCFLKSFAHRKSWELRLRPKESDLPSDLFVRLDDNQQGDDHFSLQNYIPDLIQIKLRKAFEQAQVKLAKRKFNSEE